MVRPRERLVGGEGLELYWGEPSEAILAAAAVVGLLDPGQDRQAQLLAGGPAAAVEDVLLQQAEEGLHRGVVRAGTEPAHRPVQARRARGPDVVVGAELGGFNLSSQHRSDCVVRVAR